MKPEDIGMMVCCFVIGVLFGVLTTVNTNTLAVTPEQWQYAESVCKVNGGIQRVLQNADTVYCQNGAKFHKGEEK